MRFILKARWWILLLWIALAAALMLTAPSMADLVRENGEITVPDGYSSSEASAILAEAAKLKGGAAETQIALVFHDEQGIDEADQKEIEQGISALHDKMEEIGIASITDPYSTPEAKDKLISKDGKTILTSLSVLDEQRPLKDIEQDIHQSLDSLKVEHYLTGQKQINEDMIVSSEQGLKKSEYFTVIFILLILFVVFRSVVAPFIPLLTVGLSYLVSQSIVAFLVDTVNFPISTYTQIFMVAVMFGIGTDYCILLISRYKEELQHTDDQWEAIVQTYRKAGKTVLFSGLAVLVGFTTIGLSQFMLYRSAVAVAVGIAVMLIALVTVVPFFMAVLGTKLFWPVRGSLEHKENRFWGAIGRFSLKRPWAALLIVAAVTVPFVISYTGNVSFNSMEEIGDEYESVKAYNIISESFEPGESLPSTIVIKNDEPMDNAEYMALAEKISREVEKTDGVASIRGMSRPTGEVLKDFALSNQVKTVGEGLGEGGEGLGKIQNGLAEASQALSENAPKLKEAADSTGQLVDGTAKLKDGISQLSGGLAAIEKGIREGSVGAGQLKQGLQQAQKSAEDLANAHNQLLASYQQLAQGASGLGNGLTQIRESLGAASQGLAALTGRFTSLEDKYPDLASDPDYLTIRTTVMETSKGLEQLTAGLQQIEAQLEQVASGLNQANQGYAQAAAGGKQLADGLNQIIAGLAKLQSGLDQAANGQGKIVGQLPEVESGLAQIQSGQQQIQTGFSEFSGQITQLTDGLNQSVDGLEQVSGGLTTAKDYLTEVGSTDNGLDGWYVPKEALENEQIQQVFDTYLSADRKVMKLEVVFSSNPYGREAIDQIGAVESAVQTAVKGTSLENADIAIGGVSSTFNDLKTISGNDYTRTVFLMLAGIFIILVVLLRSLVMPVYIILSLVLTFYASIGFTEWVFVDIFGYSGVSWATPFFGFVLLVALGVDYSIFLMDRFNENKEWNVSDAILHSMRNMGTVILSAAIILGGTMASMYPSGVLSMLQIATLVLTGLVLYSVVVLPFLIPVMVKLFGQANWWPFHRRFGEGTQQENSVNL
ncbi:MMPL family transporter [Paenibacillus barengoltzii]|uniref:Drug exporter of the RND superfamily n=1 Tax=Paenibacillus barengoltzii J12 TaxID=935846 RepID=A0ABY1LXY7_9BACL|nr:MMPL family transporter [Paenibacillus barengoltzii]SMF29502.1 putative drug exporter of the RND superfamily [Paenibacillus barengoltzii J12]